MSSQRVASVDNDEPTIQYEGPWEIDTVQYDLWNPGSFGGSQHRTTGRASFTFPFEGERILVGGTNRNGNDTAGRETKWECSVDGQVIPPPNRRHVQNNYEYCSTDTLPNSAHILTMTIEASESAPVWVDRIGLFPSTDTAYHATLSKYSLHVGVEDSCIRYGPGWEFLPNRTNIRFTDTPGSFMEMEFIGTQVIWKAIRHPAQSRTQSRGTYSVDGGAPVEFTVYGIREDNGLYTLFETQRFPRNRHRLRVDYEGFEAPLVLSFFQVANGDFFDRDPRTLGPELDGLRIDPVGIETNSESKTAIPTGPIIGGVIGGVLLLILLGIFAWFMRKRRREALMGAHHPSNFGAAFAIDLGAHDAPVIYSKSNLESVNYAPILPVNQTSSHGHTRSTSALGQSSSHGLNPTVSAKLQPPSIQGAPQPTLYQDSGIRFGSSRSTTIRVNRENGAPPVYTPD
ncbi:hypothetical protein FA15DRAFT_742942 [Coprinopsis marcescibilis]|uniref:Uncharacterized protein n=1 Tax=Coprinopsis marcescibilis TaxID=230819 RepID=A0A5C3KUG4_COPMA|nr:hypothetical protein FA15DRAFT_742942 [Coprinopsis marcescibilis]